MSDNYGGHVYVLVRRDLDPSQQAVQGIHAAIEATRDGIIPKNIAHPHLVLCSVSDERTLRSYMDRLNVHGIKYSKFCEPDRNNELTAIATEPIIGSHRRHFRNVSLLKFGG